MARWGGLAQCNSCLRRRACDYRLPLGQPPNPLCPDGWAEGPELAHMIPGPQCKSPSAIGKYTPFGGRSEQRRERDRAAYQYSKHKFCLACACWHGRHTPVTNGSQTWLCRSHLHQYQAWKRVNGLPSIPRITKNKKARCEKKRQVILDTLIPGPQSLREIAATLNCSVESARFHLSKLARAHKVRKIDQRRGQSWVAWQLIPQDDIRIST